MTVPHPSLTRVLCAEDEPDLRTVMSLALSEVGGFDVRMCERGHDVVSYALDWKPDLILLDVMMPEMTGPDVLAELRNHSMLASIPVIFITAGAQRGAAERYRSLGAIGLIEKPFNPMTLADELRHLWRQCELP